MFPSNKNSTEHPILATAMTRWLNVLEIEELLRPETSVIHLSRCPPETPPPSGTLILYNRSITRNYKDDGYEWIKKRNSHKVREDHVKLRVGGKCRVSGCYVHCLTNLTMHRRAYHLLDPETGTALYPMSSITSNAPPSLVLVHYLDTEIAAHLGAGSGNGFKPSSPHVQSNQKDVLQIERLPDKRENLSLNLEDEALDFLWDIVMEENGNGHENIEPTCFQQYPIHSQHRALSVENYQTLHGHYSGNLTSFNQGKEMGNSSQVMSHQLQAQHLQQASSMIGVCSQNTTQQSLESFQFQSNTIATPNVGPHLVQSHHHNVPIPQDYQSSKAHHHVPNQSKKGALKQHSQQLGPISYTSTSISDSVEKETIPENLRVSEIVDITPNEAEIGKQHTKIIISCSEPIIEVTPTQGTYNEIHKWCSLILFVKVASQDYTLILEEFSSSEMKKINPYTCHCLTPGNIQTPGFWHLMVISVREFSSTGLINQEANLEHSIRVAWKNSLSRDHSNSDVLPILNIFSSQLENDENIRILAKGNDLTFEFQGDTNTSRDKKTPPEIYECTRTSVSSDIPDERALNDVSAPPPAMALVATMLTDFPNPPIETVIPVVTETTAPHNIPAEFPSSTSHLTEASEILSETKTTMKKRSFNDAEVSAAASAWAVGRDSNDPQGETKAEEVDRHCKIRFVERLSNVIAETEVDNEPKETIPITTPDGTNISTPDGLDDSELKAMDDETLDQLIDSLLVRIVETLVEMSGSGCEIQEELNAPDKSGFTLLHYASLFNLQALIPVLLSRGANPDIASLRGRLSPLHLACGAGNFAIVELLVRHGCALQVRDTLGSSPVDHALRNGFPLLAQWMKDKIGDDKERRAENRAMEEQRMIECDEISSADIKASNVNYNDVEIEDKKFLLQSAFANLSLKDKLMLNMMVKKRREKIKKGHIPNKIIKEALNESGSESGDEYVTEKMDESSSYHEELTTKYARTSRKDESGDDHVGSVISETDKESLDIAMRLMNEEELEDLHSKSSGLDNDLKKWMLRKNYESIKEASEHLKNTLEKHCNQADSKKLLQKMKSQALAGLVIRKNIGQKKKTPSLSNSPLLQTQR